MMGGGLGGKDGEGNSNAMQFMVNYQNALDKMNKAAVEYVRGIPVVKVFQQTVHSFRRSGSPSWPTATSPPPT